MFRDNIRASIRQAITELQEEGQLPQFSIPDFSVEAPEEPSHGDYATNIAMVIAKLVKKKPLDIAATIAQKLEASNSKLIVRAEVAGSGFINFALTDNALLDWLGEFLENPNQWGISKVGRGKTVRVEYFQLNIAKRPHVGHLRSAVIGDSIKRMLLAFGYNAVSDTHVGDWGTQFGVLLLAYKEAGRPEIVGNPFDTLEQLYVAENERIAADPSRREQGKEEFAKLERGDPENRKIWQWMVEISMRKLEESAKRLGLLSFDMHRGESFYEAMMPEIVELTLRKGVANKLPDGAVVVDLAAEGLDEAVLIKSDGASTYLLRDLATIRYMKEELKFTENLYVVDVRQSHHFKQVLRIAELLGFDGSGESEHVDFGFMTLPEGAMSTRQGTAISLDAVLDEVMRRARAVIQEKNPELVNADAVAEQVGLGALKYFDLSHHRRSDIVFRWDEALSFEGNSGPYLQYTQARLKSILRKVEADQRGTVRGLTRIPNVSLDEVEHRLLVSMLRLPEAIEDALKDYTPNTLANYLYNLAGLANEFYHSHPVMQEPNETKRSLRTALVSGVALTLAKGLNLLGISAPEEM